MSEELTEREAALLRRAVDGGEEGAYMSYGNTGDTKRLTARGLLRWEQTSPFVATVYATDKGCAALPAQPIPDSEGEPDG